MPYLDRFNKTNSIDKILLSFDVLVADETTVITAGRVMAKRIMGKALFFDIQDFSGKIQCFCSGKTSSESIFNNVKNVLKIGDIVGVSGKVFLTRTEEKSIVVENFQVLSSSIKDLPEKFHGLVDLETKYRKRYLDLIMNSDTREVFRKRFEAFSVIRNFLSEHGFLEVETPVLQGSPCGASANPFKTHLDAIDKDIFLRISPETYLKQLIVGGMERVFEIGKNFRNEGVGPAHLQEFTMLEYYVAYWCYKDNMEFIQKLLKNVLYNVLGGLKVKYQGVELDFDSEWKVVDYKDLVFKDTGIDVLLFEDTQSLIEEMERKSIVVDNTENLSLGTLIDKIYKKYSRPKLIQPTFLVHHPAVLIPLARPNDNDNRVVDSFQLLVNGWEIVKAYSELADPVLQRRLLEEQSVMRESGDSEAMFLDETFLASLEYGLAPVSGLGLGIDRLVAIMTDQKNLRDVILFPTMK